MALSTYEDAIAEAKTILGIADNEFAKLLPEQDQVVVKHIEDKFVEFHHIIWWWEHLRQLDFVATHIPDEGWSNQLLPEDVADVWFVVESWGQKKQFSVYDVLSKHLQSILEECPYFEYYVVAKDLSWLIGENHHGYFFFVGESVAVRIQQLIKEHPEQWQSARRSN